MSSCFALVFRHFYFFLFILSGFVFKAQTAPPTIYQLPVQGKIVNDDDNPVPGATIQVFQGSKQVVTTATGADGKYAFQLPVNADYMVSVTGPGMITKKFLISSKGIPPERTQESFAPIIATVGLWQKIDGVDYSLLNQPANKFYYNPDKEILEVDKAYQEQMAGMIEQVRQKEASLAKQAKEADKNYQAAMKEGDKAFSKKDYTGALSQYNQALGLKKDDASAKAKIDQVNQAVKADADAKAKTDADAKAKAAADA
ncbi:MAG TPA: carboxypeptidase regulatory-like domain-containing protein, partial [Bacteroidia bacterium]|nr:carboxypeptidase regulatory-like domain-containing protein [Bacteroidia bacterium]